MGVTSLMISWVIPGETILPSRCLVICLMALASHSVEALCAWSCGGPGVGLWGLAWSGLAGHATGVVASAAEALP